MTQFDAFFLSYNVFERIRVDVMDLHLFTADVENPHLRGMEILGIILSKRYNFTKTTFLFLNYL